MSAEIVTVYGLIVLALGLFAYERVRIDATAVIVMTLLMLTGILDPAAALSGFSNIATVTVAAMFVLSAGLRLTGALAPVSRVLSDLGERNPWLALVTMMVVVGVVSGFINNTAAVAIFIPVVIGLARDIGVSPSRLLMPMSFASMFGGVATLIGTSTNLLVNSIAQENGMEPFRMFEFTPLGVVLFVAGFAYLLITVRFIPDRRAGTGQDLSERFEIAPYITEVVLGDGAAGVGEAVADNVLVRNLDVDIIEVLRNGEPLSGAAGQLQLREGDVLRVRAGAREINQLLALEGVALMRPGHEQLDRDIETERDALVEAVIAPDSQLGGQTVDEVNFPGRFGAQVLALRQHGQLQQEDLRNAVLGGGNSVLLKIDRERLAELEQEQEEFVVVSEIVVPGIRRDKLSIALLTIAAVVITAALGIVPIVVGAVTGSLVMVAGGCLTAEEAYEAINWKVIFLLAGVIPLGVALEQTGGAALIADTVVRELSFLGPTAVLGAFFVMTQLFTAIISNNATAVLFAPIAIGAASNLGVDARPFLFAITVAASMSFLTPIGYQTNTMIYGPGEYRFTDFTRIGGPLTLLVAVVATLLIPQIWSF